MSRIVLLCFNSGFVKKVFLLVCLLRVSSWYLARVCQEKELLTELTTPLWEFPEAPSSPSCSGLSSVLSIRPEEHVTREMFYPSQNIFNFIKTSHHFPADLCKYLSPVPLT